MSRRYFNDEEGREGWFQPLFDFLGEHLLDALLELLTGLLL